MLSPPDRLASGSTSRHFVRNTVDMANQLLDAIEEDISSSREAIFARDHQRKSLEQENSDLQQRLLEAKVVQKTSLKMKMMMRMIVCH